jgi:hypothetical protein
MKLPDSVQRIVNDLYERHKDLARGPDEERRKLARMIAEQTHHDDPQPAGARWGHKASSPTNPPSKDAIAKEHLGRLLAWDLFNGASREPNDHPDSIDITGQHFIAVAPVDHLRQVRPPGSAMRLPDRVQRIVKDLYDAHRNLARGTDDERRQLARMIAEQAHHDDPQPAGARWGHKASTPGNPPSKDAIAKEHLGRLLAWDLFNGTTREPNDHPDSIDITGQHFIPVAAVNHRGGRADVGSGRADAGGGRADVVITDSEIIDYAHRYMQVAAPRGASPEDTLRDGAYYAWGYVGFRAEPRSHTDAMAVLKPFLDPFASIDRPFGGTGNPVAALNDNEVIQLSARFIERYSALGIYQRQNVEENVRDQTFYLRNYLMHRRQQDHQRALQKMEEDMTQDARSTRV